MRLAGAVRKLMPTRIRFQRNEHRRWSSINWFRRPLNGNFSPPWSAKKYGLLEYVSSSSQGFTVIYSAHGWPSSCPETKGKTLGKEIEQHFERA